VPQQPAGRVECCGGVGVLVRVDPTGDLDVGLLGLLAMSLAPGTGHVS
jgi:hypothetical protein